jgi:hypothetical protein
MISSLSGSLLLGVFPEIPGDDERKVVEGVAAALEKDPATAIMLREMFD